MQLIIEQRITALVNQYRIYGTDGNGNKTELKAYAQQKRFAFKEAIHFYSDEDKTDQIFRLQAEKVMDIHGKLNIIDQQEKTLGSLQKQFKSSIWRSTWQVQDTNGARLTVQERSLPIAVFRRVWGFLPIVGDVPFPFRFHFDFVAIDSKETVGAYQKLTVVRDHYLLDIQDELSDELGWQTFAALGVALDALQAR